VSLAVAFLDFGEVPGTDVVGANLVNHGGLLSRVVSGTSAESVSNPCRLQPAVRLVRSPARRELGMLPTHYDRGASAYACGGSPHPARGGEAPRAGSCRAELLTIMADKN